MILLHNDLIFSELERLSFMDSVLGGMTWFSQANHDVQSYICNQMRGPSREFLWVSPFDTISHPGDESDTVGKIFDEEIQQYQVSTIEPNDFLE